MNLYRYYQHDGFRCETIVGIVKAKDMQEAEKIVKNHYEKAYRGEFQRDGWKLEEVEFSDDGCSEIYYGPCTCFLSHAPLYILSSSTPLKNFSTNPVIFQK